MTTQPVHPKLESQESPQYVPQTTFEDEAILTENQDSSAPFFACILSLFFPGLGQIVLGQAKKGVVLIALRLVLYIPFLFPLLLPLLPLIVVPIVIIIVFVAMLTSVISSIPVIGWIFAIIAIPIYFSLGFLGFFAIFPIAFLVLFSIFISIILQIVTALIIAVDAYEIGLIAQSEGKIYQGQFFNPILMYPAGFILKQMNITPFSGRVENYLASHPSHESTVQD